MVLEGDNSLIILFQLSSLYFCMRTSTRLKIYRKYYCLYNASIKKHNQHYSVIEWWRKITAIAVHFSIKYHFLRAFQGARWDLCLTSQHIRRHQSRTVCPWRRGSIRRYRCWGHRCTWLHFGTNVRDSRRCQSRSSDRGNLGRRLRLFF